MSAAASAGKLTDQLLKRGDSVVGTIRDAGKVADLLARYPESFHAELLDVTDTAAIALAATRCVVNIADMSQS